MWVIYAFGSAFFAGITSILAKCGIKNIDSDAAAAVRTVVVLLFSWLIVFVSGANKELAFIGAKTFIFLILSGVASGASWLCYFKALQKGDINKVAAVDKSSTVIAVLLAFIFLREPITLIKCAAVAAISIGTYLMLDIKKNTDFKSGTWLLYAFGSALFAAMTSILGKVGIAEINSNLGTAIRTVVILIMSLIMVCIKKPRQAMKGIDLKSCLFLVLSGIATGASWLCYYKALQSGPVSAVVPIDKLSILVTVIFAYAVFKEKLSMCAVLGLVLVTSGTLFMLI